MTTYYKTNYKIKDNWRKLPRSQGVFFDREIFESPAFWELSGSCIRVLCIFYLKRRLPEKSYRKKFKGMKQDTILNNGEIVFTYKEAEHKYRISKSTFERCLKKLQEVGFIEVHIPGGNNLPAKYKLVNYWQMYPSVKQEVKKSKTLVGKSTRFKTHPQKV
jgi:hypothetical protein